MSMSVQIAVWVLALLVCAAVFLLWLGVGPAVLVSGFEALCG